MKKFSFSQVGPWVWRFCPLDGVFPTENNLMVTPLVSFLREDVEELRIFGEVYIDAGSKTHFQTGDSPGYYPARSTLKPFQFLATGNPAAKGDDRERQAASLGSPSATLGQVEKLMEWYSSEDWESKLRAPAEWPHDEESRVMLRDRGDENPIFSHCFSKHMAILEACGREGWDTNSYCSRNHPYFKSLSCLLEAGLGSSRSIVWVTDGCGLPTPVLSLAELAALYRKLAIATTLRWALARSLMQEFPEWIGGPGCADTELMKANDKLIAKEGSGGLLCLGLAAQSDFPDGLGIVIKVSHGLDHEVLRVIAEYVLRSLNSHPGSAPSGENTRFHFTPFEKRSPWIDISPLNRDTSAVFPGDTPYSRDILFDTKKGSHLTLSCIRTTVHVGAHADAPNHFSKDERGIDSVSVTDYLGECQVICLNTKRGLIQIDDLGSIRAVRVLFRTNSFLDFDRWNDDFVAIDCAVIHELGKHGVRLIGIDTPSIDSATSKELSAHKATLEWDMRILEGLDLRSVTEGIYDLVAVPLRLAGADASPVRALLRERP